MTSCKESYSQPNSRLPQHPNAKFIHMWIKGIRTALAFVKLDGQPKPRLKIECSLAYPGMTAGVLHGNIKQPHYSHISLP